MTEYIDRTQEPDEAFTAVLAEFEAAPTPPEVLREQLAQAAWEASDDHEDDPSVEWENNYARDEWYRIADAALAVFRGQQDPAVQRVLALVRDSDGDEYMHGAIGDSCPACWAEDIRTALGVSDA